MADIISVIQLDRDGEVQVALNDGLAMARQMKISLYN